MVWDLVISTGSHVSLDRITALLIHVPHATQEARNGYRLSRHS